MRNVVTLALPIGMAMEILCRSDMEIRIVAVSGTNAAIAAGAQPTVQFLRGTQTLLVAAGPPCPSSVGFCSAYVGAAAPSPGWIDGQNVVTFVNIYNASPQTAEFSLPDIWWAASVTIALVMTGSTFTSGLVVYEIRPRQ